MSEAYHGCAYGKVRLNAWLVIREWERNAQASRAQVLAGDDQSVGIWRSAAVVIAEALEITTFRLVAGVSCEDLVAANADVDAWLRRQPGFRSRRIAERDDHSIVDMLIWDTAAHGERAAARLLRDLKDSPVHGVIEQSNVVWTIATVRHRFQEGAA